MHIQHLAIIFDGWCRSLLGVERLLKDCKGVTPLFEIHVHDDGDAPHPVRVHSYDFFTWVAISIIINTYFNSVTLFLFAPGIRIA